MVPVTGITTTNTVFRRRYFLLFPSSLYQYASHNHCRFIKKSISIKAYHSLTYLPPPFVQSYLYYIHIILFFVML